MGNIFIVHILIVMDVGDGSVGRERWQLGLDHGHVGYLMEGD